MPAFQEQIVQTTFISTEQTGTGSSQNIAHPHGRLPLAVIVIPTDLSPATVGQYTAVQGVHDSQNIVVTVTSGKKFVVVSWGSA